MMSFRAQAIMLSWVFLSMGGIATAQSPEFDTVRNQGANALLELVDKRHNDYVSQKWTFKMTLKPRAGSGRTMRFSTWQKDRKKRLIRFLEPGEVKGMSVLILGPGKMYVYSPQTDNVRRVAAHARRQTFMGSDMTFDDMAQVDFSLDFEAVFGKETPSHLWLDLTRKSDREIQWKKMRVRIDKKVLMCDLVEYYEGTKLVKTQTRSNPVVNKGHPAPSYHKVVVTDVDSKHQTIVEMESEVLNDSIPNSAFKKRNLVRGN